MATWNEFEQSSPEMAAAGRKLLYQFGVPLGYLATVRPDGGPRLHPICPVQTEGQLYILIIPSPKRRDLLRDGRFALHTFPAVDRDDEFYVTGRAIHRDDPALAARVRAAFIATGGHSTGDEILFALDIEHVLLATYKKRGEPDAFPPHYSKWHAPTARRGD
jgi:hypothetical protein